MVQVRDPNRLNYDRAAYTSTDGRFALHDVKPGRWTVVVQAEGHAPAWAPIVADVSRPVENQFVLEPGEFITGKVIGTDGKPVPGAAVGWANPIRADGKPDEPLELNAMTATAEDGSFRLGPLAPGPVPDHGDEGSPAEARESHGHRSAGGHHGEPATERRDSVSECEAG